jgi:small ligand-binding sensory domain FIST
MAAGLAMAQLRAQLAGAPGPGPTLGLVYITDRYAHAAHELLAHLREQWPGVRDWVGTTGVGICAAQAEYWDEPALAIALCDLPAEHYRVFSGVAPLAPQWPAQTALVHADPQTPELPELIAELAARTARGFLFGGLASGRETLVQFAARAGDAQGVFEGGLSGVAFGPGADLRTRLTQGCMPVAREHVITRADGHVVLELDGESALDVLLRELDISLDEPRRAIPVVRATLVGLSAAQAVGRTGHLQQDVRVRHIVGLDPMRQGVAVAEAVQVGERLVFCRRDAQAARADLQRICAEVREECEELAPRRIGGAIYVSCTGRGGGHFGGPSAEMQIVRHALGEVPLIGFYAAGEIAADQLYGYTGVLTVFTTG